MTSERERLEKTFMAAGSELNYLEKVAKNQVNIREQISILERIVDTVECARSDDNCDIPQELRYTQSLFVIFGGGYVDGYGDVRDNDLTKPFICMTFDYCIPDDSLYGEMQILTPCIYIKIGEQKYECYDGGRDDDKNAIEYALRNFREPKYLTFDEETGEEVYGPSALELYEQEHGVEVGDFISELEQIIQDYHAQSVAKE